MTGEAAAAVEPDPIRLAALKLAIQTSADCCTFRAADDHASEAAAHEALGLAVLQIADRYAAFLAGDGTPKAGT